jgi:hypothetical protein
MNTAPSSVRAARRVALTLAAASASALFLVFGCETEMAAAAAPQPTQEMKMMTNASATVGWFFGDVLRRLRAPRLDTLRDLDPRTLADIGVHTSELTSIEAESMGQCIVTRRRVITGLQHA